MAASEIVETYIALLPDEDYAKINTAQDVADEAFIAAELEKMRCEAQDIMRRRAEETGNA